MMSKQILETTQTRMVFFFCFSKFLQKKKKKLQEETKLTLYNLSLKNLFGMSLHTNVDYGKIEQTNHSQIN